MSQINQSEIWDKSDRVVYNPAMEELMSIVPLALILCLGIFVQAAAGFGGGLLIVPSLMWFGFTIPSAQCSLLVATIPQNVYGVWTLRDSITPKQLVLPGVTRILFLPLGVWVLWTMESLPVETIRQIVGGVVLLATVSIMMIRPTPQASIHPVWGCLAFPLSGFFQGLVGMGGPPIVFWLQAHDWDGRQMRGFLFAMFLIVDIRRQLTDFDHQMLAFADSVGLPVHVLLTKSDKLKRGQAANALLKVRRDLGDIGTVQQFSALNRQGEDEARAKLEEFLKLESS